MYKSGHMGVSLLLYSPVLFALLYFEKLFLASVGLVIVASFASIPDLDFKVPRVKHRGYSHSLIGAVVIAIPIGIVGYFGHFYLAQLLTALDIQSQYSSQFIGIYSFVMGYFAVLTHYAGDIVTPSGIPILAPYSKHNYSLSLFYAKNRWANGIAFFLGVTATVIVLVHPILFKLFL